MIKVSRGCLGEEELAAVKEAFEYGYFGLAYKVLEFEDALKTYLGAKHVVATCNGTSALHLAIDTLGIGIGDEVIVPSLTYIGSFQAISATGATPVPCDVYPDTLLINIDDVRERITPKTKAIMPIHYAGNPCDIDALITIIKEFNLRLVEDAAHAFGSIYKGQKIGGIGDMICFSFDSIKNITCGEGGAIIFQSEELAEQAKQKRLLGIDRKSHTSTWKERSWFYQVKSQGFRYHMSNINAAIGVEQLKKVDSFIARRRDICRRYDAAFQDILGVKSLPINYTEVAPHIYVIRVKNGYRDGLMAYLKDCDIETGINYVPNHLHPLYATDRVNLPHTEQALEEILTLPLHFGLSDDDVETVIKAVIQGMAHLTAQ